MSDGVTEARGAIYCEGCNYPVGVCRCKSERREFSDEEIVGTETPMLLQTINRLYRFGVIESRENEDLNKAMCDAVELLESGMRRGQAEAYEFMLATFQDLTIAEIQRLNRESLASWPIGVLGAIVDCGVEPGKHQSAVLQKRLRHQDDLVELVYLVVDAGKKIGEIAIRTAIDGRCEFVAVCRQRIPDWLK